jgi:putative SOS response-associated peptidase YedK
LVPYWLKPEDLPKKPFSTINARAETIQNVADLSRALQEAAMPCGDNRLVRVAEARREGQEKAAYHFKPKAEPFALAGVYDVWRGDGGRAITSFAIVTTDAASSVAQYHNRMPVVLDDAQFDWMRGTPDQAAEMIPTLVQSRLGRLAPMSAT